jgi:hypothetical protein
VTGQACSTWAFTISASRSRAVSAARASASCSGAWSVALPASSAAASLECPPDGQRPRPPRRRRMLPGPREAPARAERPPRLPLRPGGSRQLDLLAKSVTKPAPDRSRADADSACGAGAGCSGCEEEHEIVGQRGRQLRGSSGHASHFVREALVRFFFPCDLLGSAASAALTGASPPRAGALRGRTARYPSSLLALEELDDVALLARRQPKAET